MMTRLGLCLVLLGLLACSRKADDLASDGTESTSHASESSGTSSESAETPSETETETETGDELPPDACPATPALDSLRAAFQGWEEGYEYPNDTDLVETCTVSEHTGDLISGEFITLECVTAEGLFAGHLIEVQASLVDGEQPTQIPVEVGESLQLTLWARVWFAGGAAWVLRDADQLDDIRLIYYSTIDLFGPDDSSPAPALVEPLQITARDDICELFCPSPEAGSFVPPTECDCEREQALEFTLAGDSALIQNGSAGAIGSSMFAFVETAKVFPLSNGCADYSHSWYTFIAVARTT